MTTLSHLPASRSFLCEEPCEYCCTLISEWHQLYPLFGRPSANDASPAWFDRPRFGEFRQDLIFDVAFQETYLARFFQMRGAYKLPVHVQLRLLALYPDRIPASSSIDTSGGEYLHISELIKNPGVAYRMCWSLPPKDSVTLLLALDSETFVKVLGCHSPRAISHYKFVGILSFVAASPLCPSIRVLYENYPEFRLILERNPACQLDMLEDPGWYHRFTEEIDAIYEARC